jgi:hypothetical protein
VTRWKAKAKAFLKTEKQEDSRYLVDCLTMRTMMPSIENTGVSLAVFAGTSLLSVFFLRRRHPQRMEDPIPVNTSGPSKEEVLALRMKHFSKSQSVSYLNSGPLMIVKVRYIHLLEDDS